MVILDELPCLSRLKLSFSKLLKKWARFLRTILPASIDRWGHVRSLALRWQESPLSERHQTTLPLCQLLSFPLSDCLSQLIAFIFFLFDEFLKGKPEVLRWMGNYLIYILEQPLFYRFVSSSTEKCAFFTVSLHSRFFLNSAINFSANFSSCPSINFWVWQYSVKL